MLKSGYEYGIALQRFFDFAMRSIDEASLLVVVAGEPEDDTALGYFE